MSLVVIVTASHYGIGLETAKELAENGFDVGITYFKDEAGARETLEVVEGVGRRGEVRRLNLTGPDLPKAAGVINELADALGGLDVLVNNAGTGDQRAVIGHREPRARLLHRGGRGLRVGARGP